MSIKGNWRRHGSEVVIRWYQRFFSPRFATRHRGFAAKFCRPQREKNLWHQGIDYIDRIWKKQLSISSEEWRWKNYDAGNNDAGGADAQQQQ